jgi:hypothetical protein
MTQTNQTVDWPYGKCHCSVIWHLKDIALEWDNDYDAHFFLTGVFMKSHAVRQSLINTARKIDPALLPPREPSIFDLNEYN